MMRAGSDTMLDPVEQAIQRIQSVYAAWNRRTTPEQMRSDWDAAFVGCTVPVMCRGVSAGGIDAEWIVPADAPEDKAILYFHGGGFRLGSVASHRDLIARIAEVSRCRVLAINYRLAPEYRFPAALEDALTAFDWMRTQGFNPESIALAGDSAGGNLVLTTMLSSNPRASPLYAELVGLAPLLIQAGDRETVRDDATMLAAKARAAGVDAELQVFDGMIHVFQMFPEIPQTAEAIAAIAAFLRRHLRLNAERPR